MGAPTSQKQQSSEHRKNRRQKTGSDAGSLLQMVSIKQPITFDHKLEPVEPEIIHQSGPSPFRSGLSLMASSFLTESPSTGHLRIPEVNTAAHTHILGNQEVPMIGTRSVVSLATAHHEINLYKGCEEEKGRIVLQQDRAVILQTHCQLV
ncbi:hypothetical protein BLNAU_19743 [Blattamonas nauphoetae]|uniref:Uncharacterized protein n=1 Tax=Blattamonas nauphoetae TaxID=2049346 RepID=A0ABQ9X1X1_9EUKA|nr:hypothetical protein BLNAU_19743 [Blattamonas nauphoetae]